MSCKRAWQRLLKAERRVSLMTSSSSVETPLHRMSSPWRSAPVRSIVSVSCPSAAATRAEWCLCVMISVDHLPQMTWDLPRQSSSMEVRWDEMVRLRAFSSSKGVHRDDYCEDHFRLGGGCRFYYNYWEMYHSSGTLRRRLFTEHKE